MGAGPAIGKPEFSSVSVPEPALVSRLLEPSSGSVGPFKHFHVAAQSLVAGSAPSLGDVLWDQPPSLEKFKDLVRAKHLFLFLLPRL